MNDDPGGTSDRPGQQDRYDPLRRLRRPIAVGLLAGLAYGLVTRFFADGSRFSDILIVMTLSFLFLVPIVIGYLTVRPHPSPSWSYRLLAPWLPTILSVMVSYGVGWEGTICIVMGLPLLLIFSSLGGALGGAAAARGKTGAAAAMLLPFLAAPLEQQVPRPEASHEVHTAITIDASPAAVWAEIIEVPSIQPREQRPALFTWLGFPRPLSATLSRPGVGGLRYALVRAGAVVSGNRDRLGARGTPRVQHRRPDRLDPA